MDDHDPHKPPMEQTTADSTQTSTPKPLTTTAEPQIAKALTPEEQMALYEKELKENDWGHQPC